MNTARVYQDRDGNYRTIHQMVREEPEWAAHRVQAGEDAIAKVAEWQKEVKRRNGMLRKELVSIREHAERSDAYVTELRAERLKQFDRAEAAEAEVDRLREELQLISDLAGPWISAAIGG